MYFSHQKMCSNIATLFGLSEDDTRKLLIDSGLQWQIERGDISEQQFQQQLEEQTGTRVAEQELKLAAADIFRLNESIEPLLAELKDLGLRLVLLSNTSVTHLNFIQERFSVLSYFDAFTTSFAARALKPEMPIYQHALHNAQCAAHECFYTDDIKPYVQAARGLGIHAELYTETDLTRQQLRQLGVPVRL
ncbi:MAG: HAD hydrolase-like protein [Planctomycetaceae bacterium]|nr:HAD hydrolase-like protein [Planctomycetaceae bacterium]